MAGSVVGTAVVGTAVVGTAVVVGSVVVAARWWGQQSSEQPLSAQP
jgi:hypothetical protein